MAKATSTPGTRKSTKLCGTQKLEFCPVDGTPVPLQDMVDAIIANGGTFDDGTPIPGNVIGTDIAIQSINAVAYDRGVRANDTLTGGIVEGDECGILITNNGSTIVGEANEVNFEESVYDDYAVGAIDGTACYQVDITFESV